MFDEYYVDVRASIKVRDKSIADNIADLQKKRKLSKFMAYLIEGYYSGSLVPVEETGTVSNELDKKVGDMESEIDNLKNQIDQLNKLMENQTQFIENLMKGSDVGKTSLRQVMSGSSQSFDKSVSEVSATVNKDEDGPKVEQIFAKEKPKQKASQLGELNEMFKFGK